ncbi:MAG: RsmB/NOP family class I SAM-dependent RNA methyltransferase, partial [Candidatus Thorarchaeota archaeon]
RLALYEVKWLETDSDETISNYPRIDSHYQKEFRLATAYNLSNITKKMPVVNRLSLDYSHPTFLVKTLLDNMQQDDAIELMKANNGKRIYYVRPNKLHEDYDEILASIEGLTTESDPDVPEIYRVVEGVESVVGSQQFKDGRILIQDKASVITVDILNPQPGEKIWDACAAPGMKTQLILEKLDGIGQIVASDVYLDRVKVAIERSKLLNAQQIEWIHSDASKPEVHDADKILIDAPCTSTGILQSYPSFKWRLKKETLFALMTVQNKILEGILTNYADRPETEIVYSTCSILPHEGETQIDSAMKHHSIELLDPPSFGNRGYGGFECSNKVTRLFPHKHNSSGFFIARLRIKH